MKNINFMPVIPRILFFPLLITAVVNKVKVVIIGQDPYHGKGG
jgi:uracil DNA glycosylase